MTTIAGSVPVEWQLDLAYCPTDTVESMLEFALRYAVLAPSTHNAQPWRFRLMDGGVDVLLDTTRSLAVSDPLDREAIISVGAAVLNLRAVLARLDLSCACQPWPEPLDPECVMRITVEDDGAVDRETAALADFITRRHTSRSAFDSQAVSSTGLADLRRAAAGEGAHLHVVTDYPDRRTVAQLVSQADRHQMADAAFRRELASWLRATKHGRDGVHGYPGDSNELVVAAAPLVVRTFDVGAGRAAADLEIAAWSPTLVLLATPGDSRSEWLNAGQALERVLLRATALGLCVGFLNQPIEVDQLRAQLAPLFGTDETPQVLLRLGYGPTPEPQRRRPIDDVLLR